MTNSQNTVDILVILARQDPAAINTPNAGGSRALPAILSAPTMGNTVDILKEEIRHDIDARINNGL